MTLTSSPKNSCHSKAQKRACHPHPPCPTFPYVHGVWELRVRRPWEPPWPPSPGRERRSKTVKVTRQRPCLCINPQPGGPSPWERARPFCTPSGKPGTKSFKVVRAPTSVTSSGSAPELRRYNISYIVYLYSTSMCVCVHTSCIYIYCVYVYILYCIILFHRFWSTSLGEAFQGIAPLLKQIVSHLAALPRSAGSDSKRNTSAMWHYNLSLQSCQSLTSLKWHDDKESIIFLSIYTYTVCMYVYIYIYTYRRAIVLPPRAIQCIS